MKIIFYVAACGLLLSACATVTRGASDQWVVTSDPTGAKVETTDGHFCDATPCTMKISRKANFTATVTKEGYKPGKIVVTSKVAGMGATAMAGNVILGGPLGLGIDAVTGAEKDLTPNPASIVLEKEDAAPASVAAAN